MRPYLGLALLICAACGVGAQVAQSSGLKDTLMALDHRFMRGWQRHDAAGLGELMAPEFVYVGPQGITPREAVLRGLVSGCDLKSYSFGDPILVRTSATSAMVMYTIHQQLMCFGEPAPPDVLNTDTFVLRDGRWLLLVTTSTTLVKPVASKR